MYTRKVRVINLSTFANVSPHQAHNLYENMINATSFLHLQRFQKIQVLASLDTFASFMSYRERFASASHGEESEARLLSMYASDIYITETVS
jgi:hypothetical protein